MSHSRLTGQEHSGLTHDRGDDIRSLGDISINEGECGVDSRRRVFRKRWSYRRICYLVGSVFLSDHFFQLLEFSYLFRKKRAHSWLSIEWKGSGAKRLESGGLHQTWKQEKRMTGSRSASLDVATVQPLETLFSPPTSPRQDRRFLSPKTLHAGAR
jgi:hypothetical protein